MPLISNTGHRIGEDAWSFVADDAPIVEESCPVVSLARLKADWLALSGRNGRLAVVVQPDEAVEELAPFLARLDMVAIAFPKFRDGRGYTSARLLRERLGFDHEIRAVGDVLLDQLVFMARCGFDSFVVKNADEKSALDALERYTHVYQPAADGRFGVLFHRAHPAKN